MSYTRFKVPSAGKSSAVFDSFYFRSIYSLLQYVYIYMHTHTYIYATKACLQPLFLKTSKYVGQALNETKK